MKLFGSILDCLVIGSTVLAQRDQFGVRYLAGSLDTKTSKESWDNKLDIRANVIRLELERRSEARHRSSLSHLD